MAVVGLLASRLRWRVVLWLVAGLLLAFCVLTGFSVGLFYLPASGVLVAAALLQYVGPHPAP